LVEVSFTFFSYATVAKHVAVHYGFIRREFEGIRPMKKLATRLAVSAAAASMAVMPIAAQANTRAGDNAAVYSTSAAQTGVGRTAEGEDAKSGFGIILGLLAAAAIIGGVFFASDSDDNGQSPGT
jgi:hypothetical protein